MTANKNPRNFKKKGAKKKTSHPFARKEWYNVLAPGFDKRCITLTPCNKTAGLTNSADSLRGRVFNISLADCNKEQENNNWRKLKFQIDEIKGFDCYTNFYGMDITRDKACSMVKKWYSLIEAFVQAKTSDGYILRMFCIAFTKKTFKQVKATCYAKASHQKLIRKKMMELCNLMYKSQLSRSLSRCSLKRTLANKFRKNAARSSHSRTTA
jgi:small subunit ribosomal protein S3Ae